MDADFPRHSLYTSVCWMRSTRVHADCGGVWGMARDSRLSLPLHPCIIADFLTDDEEDHNAFVLCSVGFSSRFFVGTGRSCSSGGDSCARSSCSCSNRCHLLNFLIALLRGTSSRFALEKEDASHRPF